MQKCMMEKMFGDFSWKQLVKLKCKSSTSLHTLSGFSLPYAIQGSPGITDLAGEHFLDTVSYNDRSHPPTPKPTGQRQTVKRQERRMVEKWMGRWIWVGTSPTNIRPRSLLTT